MKNRKCYKFKSKYLNSFFRQNKIFFIKVVENNHKITFQTIKRNNEKYTIVIIDEKITNIRERKEIKELIQTVIDKMEIPNDLYTNIRLNFSDNHKIYISERMDLKITTLEDNVKMALIIYSYFEFKSLIKRQGVDAFYKQYKVCGLNETLGQWTKFERERVKDYFDIIELKNMIRIYKKEIDCEMDCENPSLKDRMIFKYFDNYFSKFAIVNYDETKVKDFISDYYVTEIQSEDQMRPFIEKTLLFYQMVTNNSFLYKNSCNLDLRMYKSFYGKKTINLKYKNFYKYFDEVMTNKRNYNNFMFMLEILNLTEYNSRKKKIINYISVFELLLVKKDRYISSQLQAKCMQLVDDKKCCENEIKLAYDYRSKIIHGEQEEAISKLHQLSLIKDYQFTKKEIDYETYLNFEQMIEDRLSKRLYVVLRQVLKRFIFDNQYITDLKNNDYDR